MGGFDPLEVDLKQDLDSSLEDPEDQVLVHCMVVPTYLVACHHECLANHKVVFIHVISLDFEQKDTCYYPSWGQEIRQNLSNHKY